MRSIGMKIGGHVISMLSFMFGHDFMLFLMKGQKSLKLFVGVSCFHRSYFVTLVQILGCLLKVMLRV